MTALIHVEETPITPLLEGTGFPELYYDVSYIMRRVRWRTMSHWHCLCIVSPYTGDNVTDTDDGPTGSPGHWIHLTHRLLILPDGDIDRRAELISRETPIYKKCHYQEFRVYFTKSYKHYQNEINITMILSKGQWHWQLADELFWFHDFCDGYKIVMMDPGQGIYLWLIEIQYTAVLIIQIGLNHTAVKNNLNLLYNYLVVHRL